MLTYETPGYTKAIFAYNDLLSTVASSGKQLEYTLESKHRAQCIINNIKNDLLRFEDVLKEYDFIDSED